MHTILESSYVSFFNVFNTTQNVFISVICLTPKAHFVLVTINYIQNFLQLQFYDFIKNTLTVLIFSPLFAGVTIGDRC